ncbi:GntR family transcriptional regulator [Marinomonas sp. 15G1-11]|uniref:GntR family transcriptional regulator n=1 Tax=Marinomonas phaeophyticola TaxID=3004091 RepID=A0ABT4JUC3_9GAMM|nr:GntR family transcriptional regulator [Marinomonas sp. 15G1-11]MCZ2721383.1 GntR family transcriptional regulator [Marinomonas sp. 15G1-11]
MIFSNNYDNETVVGLIASAIRRDISFGELSPDKRLKIEELRTRYGGSSHSLREALTRLSTQGLVEANAQRGFRVSSATEEDLKDIIQLRWEIEKLGLEWSLKKGDVKWQGKIIASSHELSRAQESVMASPIDSALEWDEANRMFHINLMSASGSPRLIATHTQLYDQSRRFILRALREQQLNFTSISNNQKRLVDAILVNDIETAKKCLQQDIEGNLAYSIQST